jgi:IS30 family transposase
LGKRYTEEEKRLIQELSEQGQTDESIANQLGRTPNAIRNIRHRTNIKAKETITIQQLKETNQTFQKETKKLENHLKHLQRRKSHLKQAIEKDNELLQARLHKELLELRKRKPELFTITIQDQMNTLTAELTTSFIRWLIE